MTLSYDFGKGVGTESGRIAAVEGVAVGAEVCREDREDS